MRVYLLLITAVLLVATAGESRARADDEHLKSCLREKVVEAARISGRIVPYAASAAAHGLGLALLTGTIKPGNFSMPSLPTIRLPSADELKNFVQVPQSELVARARRDLSAWRERRTPPARLGEFIIRSELQGSEGLEKRWLAELLSRYETQLAIVKQDFGGKTLTWDQVLELGTLLNRMGLRNYGGQQGRMIDFTLNGKGNCDAETAVVLSLLNDAGLKFPPGVQLGAQNFSDHVQPVLYDSKSGEVFDLIRGLPKAQGVRGEIYHPITLMHATLKYWRISTPTDEKRDLLIVAGTLPGALKASSSGPNGSTRLWPSSKIAAGGATPESSTIAFNGERERSDHSWGGWISRVMQREPEKRIVTKVGDTGGLAYKYRMTTDAGGLIGEYTFQAEDDRRVFEGAYGEKAKAGVLEALARRFLRQLSDAPELKEVLRLLEEPKRIVDLEDGRRQRLIDWLDGSTLQTGHLMEGVGDLLNVRGAGTVELRKVRYESEAYRKLMDARKLLSAKLVARPAEWLAWLETVPPERRNRFEGFLHSFDWSMGLRKSSYVVPGFWFVEGEAQADRDYPAFLSWLGEPGNIAMVPDAKMAAVSQLQVEAMREKAPEAENAVPAVLAWVYWDPRGFEKDREERRLRAKAQADSPLGEGPRSSRGARLRQVLPQGARQAKVYLSASSLVRWIEAAGRIGDRYQSLGSYLDWRQGDPRSNAQAEGLLRMLFSWPESAGCQDENGRRWDLPQGDMFADIREQIGSERYDRIADGVPTREMTLLLDPMRGSIGASGAGSAVGVRQVPIPESIAKCFHGTGGQPAGGSPARLSGGIQ
ncbi:MAG TPA: hypothetical protein VM598_01555 [Bdellovibrionota bacterium]|nr:hypothetical protein [Bdellovibrionota bacterium]